MSDETTIISEYNEYLAAVQEKKGMEFLWDLLKADDGTILGYIGGSYAAWATGRVLWEPGDVDVWAISNEAFDAINARLPDYHYMEVSRTDIASRWCSTVDMRLTVNVVRPHPGWVKFPEDIINSFDLSVSRAVFTQCDKVLADRMAGAQEGKILMVNDPLRTLERVLKYNSRGHVFSRWELLKLFRSWDEMSAERKQEMISTYEPHPVVDDDDDDDYSDDESREYGFYDDDYWDGE